MSHKIFEEVRGWVKLKRHNDVTSCVVVTLSAVQSQFSNLNRDACEGEVSINQTIKRITRKLKVSWATRQCKYILLSP